MLWQPEIPDRYCAADEEELGRWIQRRREELGGRLLILGHHYQQDEVIRHADFVGDSLKLSQIASREAPRRGTQWIVFCGVHFMAETADVLTDESVRVILPDLGAGCSMADMAAYDEARAAVAAIERACEGGHGTRQRFVPITYVNSSAAIKALVGQLGGACCTSSNAQQVFDWALRGGDRPLEAGESAKLLFLPDQHLGRNTAHAKGFATEVDEATNSVAAECAVWDPRAVGGGLTEDQIREARVLLWRGHCSVHGLFRPEHVKAIRARGDGTKVLVHPECTQEVVDAADLVGSTEFIIRSVESAEPGARFAVGTEVNLVSRLARAAKARGVAVEMLSGCQCLCTTMYRIDQAHLAWALDELAEDRVVNEIRVHPEARRWARVALDRMLANVAQQAVFVD
jgi:quinolinate synthase